MNNRAFTLIELLAVLLILAIVALIAAPITIKLINNSKKEARLLGAENYIHAVNLSLLSNKVRSGNCTVQSDGNLLCGSNEVVIDIDKNKPKGGEITVQNYKVTSIIGLDYSTEKNQITYSMSSVDDEIKLDKVVCYLKSGNSKEIGSKYTCKLDTNRDFYVLKISGNEVILIMDQNYIDDYVPYKVTWCTDGNDNSCNHDNIDTYISYIQTKFGDDVTVSIPDYYMLAVRDCNLTTDNSCPSWITGNLDNSTIKGYWLSTVTSSSNNDAYVIFYRKRLGAYGVDYGVFGIRPTIIIKKTNLN